MFFLGIIVHVYLIALSTSAYMKQRNRISSQYVNTKTHKLHVRPVYKHIIPGSCLRLSTFLSPNCEYSCSSSDVRRKVLTIIISTSLLFMGSLGNLQSVAAVTYDFNDLTRLKRGLQEISYLIDNWDDKTTYCNFGEFKMELMDAKNKEGLISAAKDSGLLDKSKTMNVMCKRDPEVVRAFLGLTTENLTMQKADQLMKSKSTIEKVDPDNIDDYFEVGSSHK